MNEEPASSERIPYGHLKAAAWLGSATVYFGVISGEGIVIAGISGGVVSASVACKGAVEHFTKTDGHVTAEPESGTLDNSEVL